ncbi:MAG: PKD domain-containing protein [Salinivirgaceae bacterium]
MKPENTTCIKHKYLAINIRIILVIKSLVFFASLFLITNFANAQSVKIDIPSGIFNACTGNPTYLEFSIGGGGGVGPNYEYEYTIDGGPSIFVIGPNPHSIAISAAGTYVVVGCIDQGNMSVIGINAGNDTEVVNALPQPTANITPDPANVGISTNLTLNSNGAGGTGGLTYTWTDGGFFNIAPTNATSTVFNSAAAGAYAVQVVVTDANLCTATDNITVNVFSLSATVATTPSPANTCPSNPVLLNASPTGGSGTYTHSWSGAPGGSLSFTNIEDPTFTYAIAGTYNLNYTVTDVVTTATATVPVTIIVNPLPASKLVTSTDYCLGAAILGTLTVANCDLNTSYTLINNTTSTTVSTQTAALAGDNLTWSNLSTANYFVRITNQTTLCTIDLPIENIAENPLPVVAPTIDDNPVCNGTTTLLHANAPTATAWVWNNAASITGSNTVPNPVASPIAFTNYTVTVTDANGCQNSGSRSVSVTAQPTININDDQGNTFTICEGDNIILTGTSTKSIAVWAWSNGAATPSTTVAPGTTNTYTLTVTDTDGCTNNKSQVVTVNDRPTANAGSDEVMCVGTGQILTATATDGNGVYGYAWSGGTTPANQSTTVNPANDATYTVTVTDGNGCFHSDDVFIDVVTNPTVSIAAALGFDLAICDGESTDLLATPASGTAPYVINWPHSGASTNTVTVSPGNPVFNAGPVLTNYIVNVTDFNGCLATNNVNVTTNSLTLIAITNDGQAYCQDAGVVAMVGTPPGGVWGDVSTPGFLTLPAGTFDPAPPKTPTLYTVDYTYTNTNSCVSNLQATIEILPYSTPAVSITNPLNGDTYCNVGEPIDNIITSDNVGGEPNITRTITSVSAGVVDLGNGVGTFDPNDATGAGIGSHTITYTVTTPGCNNAASVTVNVGNPVNITPIVDMCVGDPDQNLVVDVPGGTWHIIFTPSSTGVPNPTLNYAEGDPLARLQATVDGHYDVGYELSVAACTNTTMVSCDVHALPVLDFDIGSFNQSDLGIIFCDNLVPVALTPTPGGGGFTSIPPGNVNTSWFEPIVVGVGTYNIIYNLTDANGCSNSITSEPVNVIAAPVVDITGLNAAYCSDEIAFTITGNPTSGTLGFGTFAFPGAWGITPAVEATDNGDGTAEIDPMAINPTGPFNITYSVADLNGCTGTITEPFTINLLPTVDFNGFPAIVPPALTSQICKNAAPITLIGNPTSADGLFTGDGIVDNGDGTAIFDPSAETVGNHNITYTWTDPATSCVNFVTKTIEILPLPLTFAVTAPSGLDYCSSGAGITIGVSASEGATNNYYLMRNGLTQMDVHVGNSASFNFTGAYNAANYTVIAENADGCRLPFGNTVVPIEYPAIGDAGSITGNAGVCADGITVYNYSVPIITNATDHVWTIPAIGVTVNADNNDNIDLIFDNTFVGGNISVYGDDPASVCPAGNSNFITVNPIAEPISGAAAIVSSTGIFVVCEGTSGLVYSINPVDFSNETSFLWQIVSGGYTITSTTTGSSINVDFPLGCTSGVIQVQGVNACGASAWVTQAITVNPIPNVAINPLGPGDVITCDPLSRVTLNASSTEVPATITNWLWTANGGGIIDGATNAITASSSHEGNFAVQIEVTTNLLACYNTATIAVGADRVAPIATIDPHGVLDCNNNNLTLQANSSTASSYLWSFTPPANITNIPPYSMSNPNVDQPGTYTVTVTDLSNSCTGSASTLVIEDVTPPNISVTTPAAAQLTCLVNAVNVTGSSTTLGALYSWTGPGAATITTPLNNTTSVNIVGVYTLEVTDPANGCTATLPVTVNQNITVPTITALVNNDAPNQNITCANTSVQLQATVGTVADATFGWSAGAVPSGAYNQYAEVSAAGIYTATATHPISGCTDTEIINVTQDLTAAATTNITSAGTELTCSNLGTLNLAAAITGDAGGTYLWSGTGTLVPPLTNNNVNVTSAGTFTLTYRHSTTGCPTTANIIVTDRTALPVVTINPGPYVITCANISATSAITPTLTAIADANILTTYAWTDAVGAVYSNQTGVVTTVDKVGTYTITATNPYGCVSSANVAVTSSLTAPNISVTTPAAAQLTCLVNAVNVTGSSTTIGASYSWTGPGAATITTPLNNTTSVNLVGVYTLEVTDPANGCTASLPVTVNENITVPTITALVNNDIPNQNITCINTSVQLQATVGTVPDATFWWSAGAVPSGSYNQFAEVSAAGIYTATATHPISGCTDTEIINVTQDLTAAATTNITSAGTELTCTNSDILNLTAAITGDAGGTYLWSGTGTLVPPLTNNNVNVTSAGTFTLTYSHSTTGCPTTANIIVTDRTALPVVTINPGPYVITCANISATSAITPTLTAIADANILTTYAWTDAVGAVYSNQTSVVTTVDKVGTYIITATNPYGCVSSANVAVTSSLTTPNISVTTPAAAQLTCLVNTVNVTGSSTTIGASYSWTGPGAATIATPLNNTTSVDLAGVYTLEVTDPANGCTDTRTVTVTEDIAVPVITAVNNNDGGDLTCTNTIVEIEAIAVAVPAATFTWSTLTGTIVGLPYGANNQFINVSGPGSYTVTATDPANGCSSAASSLTVNQVITTTNTATINGGPFVLTCTNGGQVTLDGSITGTLGGTYLWTTVGGNIIAPATTEDVVVNAAGTYTLHYYDPATGCETTAITVVTDNQVNPTVSINPGPYVITCTTPTPIITATGDVDPLTTYSWTGPGVINNSTTLTPDVNLPGVFTITALGTNGCTAQASINVSLNNGQPDISVNTPNDITCANLTSTISGSSSAAVTYNWLRLTGTANITAPTANTTTVDGIGSFQLTVTSTVNGCTNSGTVFVNSDYTSPAISVTDPASNLLTCDVTTVQLAATTVVPGVTYSWSTLILGATISTTTSATPFVDRAGLYTVVATHPISGCPQTETVLVNENKLAPTINLTSAATVLDCITTQITIDGSATTNADSYTWTNSVGGNIVSGQGTNSIIVDAPGNYTLVAEHAATGCTSTSIYAITNDIVIPTVTINAGAYEIRCTTPIETIGAVGDVNPATTYLWSGPGIVGVATGLNISVNAPGNYTVVATAPNGCFSSDVETVLDNTAVPDLAVNTPTDITCLDLTSTISGTSSIGVNTNWLRILGSGNIASNTVPITTVDGPGTFRVTITSLANGCSNTADVVVNENITPPGLSVTSPASNILTCTVLNVQVVATTAVAGSSYNWNTAIVGATISNPSVANPFVDRPGIYNVQATHPVSGCSQTNSVTVNSDYAFPTISIVPSATVINCAQSTITLNASGSSASAINFNWVATGGGNIVSGGSTNTAVVSSAGTYTLTAEHNITGCTQTGVQIITDDLVPPVVTITGAPYYITCTTPSPVLSATVNVASNIDWTGPGVVADATTLSPTVNAAGTYIVTATALNGCTDTDNVLVQLNNAPPNISVNPNPDDITCASPTVLISGNTTTPGATFLWTEISANGVTITNDATKIATVNGDGDFRFTVTAPNGCFIFDDVSVAENISTPNLTVLAVDDEVLTCSQTTVTLSSSSTTTNALFAWSTLIVGATITNGSSPTPIVNMTGNYTVTVTDPANGCTTSGTSNVTSNFTPPTMIVAAPIGQITCGTPTLQLDATGSTNTTTYSWVASNGGHILLNPNTAQPTVDAAGRYTVTGIHTTTGCTDTEFTDVTSDTSIPNIDDFDASPNTLTCNITTVTLRTDALLLGAGVKDILWTTSDGSFINIAQTTLTNPTVNAPGTYVVTITNTSTGCFAVRGVTVNENTTPPTIQIDDPLDLTCSLLQVSISSSATSADLSPLTYLWSAGPGGVIDSGDGTSNPLVSEPATYNLTVTDLGNGCFNISSVSVAEDVTLPPISVDITPDVITCANPTIELSGSSAYPNVSYNWITLGAGVIVNGATTTPTVNALGTYNLVVTNLDNNCSDTSANVNVIENKVVPVVTTNSPSGDLTCSVSQVTISVNQAPDYAYLWSGPGTIANPNSYTTSVNTAGTYTILVEDIINGCTTSSTINVVQDIVATPSPVISNTETCFGSPNPVFTAVGTNVKWYGDVALTQFLANGLTYTPTVTAAGVHPFYATSTGANGCISLPREVLLTIHTLPNAPVTFGNSICEGTPQLTITSVGSSNWYDNTNLFLGTGISYLPAATVIAVGTYTYYATQTDIYGCESQQTATTYTIKTVPGVLGFVDNTLEVCQTFANPTFTVAGSDIKWYKNIAGAVLSIGNTYQPLDAVPGAYTYYATQTVNLCESPNASGTLTINPMPAIYIVTGGGSFCEGGVGVTISLSNSDPTATYELWLDETTLITDLVGISGVLSFGNQTAVGSYSVYAYNTTSLCRRKMNGGVTVSENPLPGNAGLISGSNAVCQDETGVVFSIAAVSNAISYVWTVPAGFTIVSGNNSNSITVDIQPTAASGTVSVYATNLCGTGATSALFSVLVKPLPGIAANLIGDNTLCVNEGNVLYSLDNVANATEYVWSVPVGSTIVSGLGSRQITVDYGTSAISDVITVYGKNTCGVSNTLSMPITVSSLPTSIAGTEQNLCNNQTVLSANQPPLGGSGAWTLFDGAVTFTDATLYNTPLTAIGRGKNTLVWTLTNASGCISTDTVDIYNNTLFVNAGSNQVLCSPSTSLNALTPLTNGTWFIVSGGGTINVATSPTSAVTGLNAGENRFEWIVTNPGCISRDTVSIFNDLPTQPNAGIDQTLCDSITTLAGNNASIGIGQWTLVSGSGTITTPSQFNSGITALGKGTNQFRWTITNGSCSLSDDVIITNNIPTAANAGADQELCLSAAVLGGNDPLIGTGLWTIILGDASFNNNTQFDSDVSDLETGTNILRWTISNNGCTSNDDVTLTVFDSINITSQPQSQTLLQGSPANFNVSATGSNVTYQWQKDYVNITDSTFSSYSIDSVVSADAGFYRCIVTGNCGSVISDLAKLTVNLLVSITTQPDSLIRCESQSAQFSVLATGSIVSYQWKFKGSNLTDGGGISGVNSRNLVISSVTAANAGSYSCVVIGTNNNAFSDAVTLTVNSLVTITSQPINRSVCRDGVGYFEVQAIPDSLNYQWQKNGVNMVPDIIGYISGTTGNVLTISGATQADVGVYRCVITGGCNVEITSTSSLVVNEIPAAAGTISGPQTVCQGTTDVFYVVPEIANAETYVWDVPYGATIVGDDGTRSIQVDYGNNALVDVITVYGKNSCGNGTVSAPLPVTVNPLPVAFANIDQSICDHSVDLNANQVAGGVWSITAGDGVIVNPNIYNTKVNLLNHGINTFKWTVTQNECTSFDEVNITNLKMDVNAGPDQVICSRNTLFEAQTPLTGASWRVISSTGQGTIVNPTSPTSLVTGLNQDANVFAWQVNNEGCISSDTVSITNNKPFEPDAGEDQIIAFKEYDLNAMTPEDGTTGFWELLSGGGSFVDRTDPKTRITDLMPGPNTIVWTVQRANCTLSDTVIIENILLLPADAGNDQTICTDATKISAKVPNIGTGEWSVTTGAANFGNISSPTTTVTNLGPGNNILRWTVRTSIIGVTWDELTIVNNKPTTANAGTDITLCTNQTNLAGNPSIYGTGVWTLLSGAGTIADTNNAASPITNLGSGSNILKWTINNNGCISDDFVSVINNTATTAQAGNDQTICFDSTSLFPNTPTVGTGSWSVQTGSGTFNGNVVTHLAPDKNVLIYTITKNTCKSIDTIIITNNKPTTPAAGYDQKLCVDTFKLDANQALLGTGIWTVQSGSGKFADSSENKTVVSNIANGINIYRWTITKNGCTEQDEVFISNDFVLSTAGNDIDLCESEYQLLASNPSPGVGTWSVVGSSGAIFTNQNNPNTLVANLSNGANQLRWSVKNGTCVSSDIVVVGSYKPTDALAGENQAVCGKTASLKANTPTFGDGLWILMSGSGSFDNDTIPNTTIRNLGVGPNVLRWTISQRDCFSYDETVITSNLPIEVFGGNDQVVCSDTAVLSANPPTIGTGRWSIISGSGSFDDPSDNQTIVRFLGKGQNKLQWKVSSSDCHVPDTVVITSSIPTTAVAGADQILCTDSTLMAGNTPLVGTGEWIMVSGAASIDSINDPKTKLTTIGLGKTTLRWTVSLDGCFSFDEVTLTNNQPSKPFAGYDTDICGDSVRLFAEPTTVGIGEWTLVSGDAVIATPDSNQTQVNKIKFNENTFRWTVTNLNCTLYDDVIITSNYEYVNAGENRTVNVPNIQLIGNKPGQGVGQWKVSASPASIENPANFETMVIGLGSGANIFTWTITNDGCTSTDNIVINYIVMPVADFAPSAINGCPPLSVNFVNTSIGGAPYKWDFGDGETSTEHSLMHIYAEPGSYKATLTATAPLGLSVIKDTLITVFPLPLADFDIAPKTIYIPDEHISCFNYSKKAVSSLWDFGDGETSEEFAPVYSYTEEGFYDITLTAISVNGCEDTMTIIKAVEVIKRSKFIFPEAFTPDPSGSSGGAYDPEDRSNNVFYPMIIDGEIDNYEMIIYNRAGVLVFKTSDVLIGWDGYYRNKLLPEDVYIFIVKGTYNSGKPFQKTGNVLLIVKDN